MSSLYLVHGPPGTGKTTYLNRQATHGAQKHGPDQVCIASLTRTAAHEIAGRDNPIPDTNVGTLHAHAYHALDRPDLAETPEGIQLFNAAHPAHKLTGATPRMEDTLPLGDPDAEQATEGDALHNQVMTNRARMIPRSQWTAHQLEHDQRWTDFKTETGRLDFTDLIQRAITDTNRHPANPDVWLFDEAQDFSRLELELATHWARHAQTAVIVADGDQAIYGWRGADPQHLYDLPRAGERVLEQSHRVPRAVHHLATNWIGQLDGRHPVTYKPTAIDGDFSHHPGHVRAPEAWLDQVLDDTTDGRTAMILTSCGYMLTPLIAVLRQRGIPFHNPYRPERGQWNPMRGARRLRHFLAPKEEIWGDQARFWTWADMHAWAEPLSAKDALARGAKALIESKVTEDRFGESRADQTIELDEFLTLIGTTDLHHPALKCDIDWWEQHLLASQKKTAEYPLKVARQHGLAAIADKPLLTVGTIHSVKGGEADTVWIAPDLSNTGMGSWERPGPAHDQIVRLFYVALTRARHRARILQPAGWAHIPTELLHPDQEELIAA